MDPPKRGGATEGGGEGRTGWARDGAAAALSALVAAALAASYVGNESDAAHDTALARVLGLRPQAWRALDVLAGNALALFPLGTRTARAEWGGALVAAVAAAVVAAIAARLLASCADAPRVRFAVTAVAATTAAASVPWQIESAAVGGSVSGALLVLAPLALLDRALMNAAGALSRVDAVVVGLVLGLGLGHEPLVGACAVAGCAARLASDPARRNDLLRTGAVPFAGGFVSGLGPWALAMARVHAAGEPLGPALAAAWAGENGNAPNGSLAAFCHDEIGVLLGGAAAVGMALALLVAKARPLACGMVAITASCLACAGVGLPMGPERYGAPVLAAVAGVCVLAAVAMQAAVRTVATARLPFASGSAAMIVLLEVVLPVETADRTMARLEGRSAAVASAAAWNDLALGTLPPRTVVLLPDARLALRAQGAAASDAVRGDLLVVPLAAGRPLPWARLADDPGLMPLSRDLALSGAPTEASLSGLAALRPVALVLDPHWDSAVGRHLVPLVFFDRFEREPRGASDRRRALEEWSALRDRLAQRTAGEPDVPSLR